MGKLKIAIILDMVAVVSVIVAFVLFVVNDGNVSLQQIMLITGVLVIGVIAMFAGLEFSKENRMARIMGVMLWGCLLFIIGAYVLLKYYLMGQ